MNQINFQDVQNFLYEFTGISRSNVLITPGTLLEDDLHITGDDGAQLLEMAEQHFDVTLSEPDDGIRGTFNLKENEYLFHSEGFDPIGLSWLIDRIRGKPKPVVKSLSAGEFHAALLRAKNKNRVV